MTDDSAESTEVRWYEYKKQCREHGLKPLAWGDWLANGQPLVVEDT